MKGVLCFVYNCIDFSLWTFYCTQPWPEDALQRVAYSFLEDADIEQREKQETVDMCKYFHQSARILSER